MVFVSAEQANGNVAECQEKCMVTNTQIVTFFLKTPSKKKATFRELISFQVVIIFSFLKINGLAQDKKIQGRIRLMGTIHHANFSPGGEKPIVVRIQLSTHCYICG